MLSNVARKRLANNRETRKRLAAAMRQLRKRNLIARMGFECSLNTAVDLLREEMEARPEILGAVYTSRETWPRADSWWPFRVYLNYTARPGAHSARDRVIGAMVVAALCDNGLTPVWNGNSSNTIMVQGKMALNERGD